MTYEFITTNEGILSTENKDFPLLQEELLYLLA